MRLYAGLGIILEKACVVCFDHFDRNVIMNPYLIQIYHDCQVTQPCTDLVFMIREPPEREKYSMRSDPVSIWDGALSPAVAKGVDIQGEHTSLAAFCGPFPPASRTFVSQVLMDKSLSGPFSIFRPGSSRTFLSWVLMDTSLSGPFGIFRPGSLSASSF